ncbi:hypothetical protein NIES3275_46020 [Microchaete diplosiphon NIES-3275]|nr:hypothetical protein NIES3275_46020 [Microchaete diplosiphon NIES-3275]
MREEGQGEIIIPQSPLPLIPRGGPEFPNPQSPVPNPQSPIPSPHYPLSPEGAPSSPIPIYIKYLE